MVFLTAPVFRFVFYCLLVINISLLTPFFGVGYFWNGFGDVACVIV